MARNRVARLNASGTLDGFNPNVNGTVYSMAVQADGKIVIGGAFTVVGGVARNRIARLNADGTLDMGFNPNANGTVISAAVQADGKILVAGGFTAIGVSARNRIVRLQADGTVDVGFNADLNGSVVYSTAVQTDGKIVVGGNFAAVGGTTRNYIARLNADGTLDTGFNPDADSTVEGIAVQADGKIVIGGIFSYVGGVTRGAIARLENDPATQSLTPFSATAVRWLRGGASPEVEQVSFELSTDGGSVWTPLGAGTRIAGGWELDGVSLPDSGQLRARARTTGGYNNASSGRVETVTAFTLAPEIAVEQPAGTNLSDGGTKVFGAVLAGGNASLIFTILNTGSADLTGLTITIDGTNASDFTVTAAPIAPVAPNGSTTFTVRFAPTVAATIKTAALHMANNDADENPFDINLSGRALDPNADDDGDGITNQAEVNLASFGFNPLVDNTAMVTLLRNNGRGFGLYTASDLQTLALGRPVLARDPSSGHFHLDISVEKSPNLSTWMPLLGFTPTYNAVTGHIDLEITPDASDAQFYRVFGSKP